MQRGIKLRLWIKPEKRMEVFYSQDLLYRICLWKRTQILLQQWTGLLDHEGNDIWEHDIVKGYWKEDLQPQVVIYQAPSFVMKTRTKGGRWSKYWSTFLLAETERQPQVVIGNIYETPELI